MVWIDILSVLIWVQTVCKELSADYKKLPLARKELRLKEKCLKFKRIADFIGLPYFSGFLLGLKSHALISYDYLSQSKFVPLPRGRVAMCLRSASKYLKKFRYVSKQACIIAYEVRISFKGPLSVAFVCFLIPCFLFFKQHPWLFTF